MSQWTRRPVALHESALSPSEYDSYAELIHNSSVSHALKTTATVQDIWSVLLEWLSDPVDKRTEKEILAFFNSPTDSKSQQTSLVTPPPALHTLLAMLRFYAHSQETRHLTRDLCFLAADPVMLKSHGSATVGFGRPVTSISSQQRAVSQPDRTRPLPPPKRISSAEPFMLPQAQSIDVSDAVTGPKPNPFRPALPSTSSSSTSVTVTPTNPFQMPLSPPPSVISGSSDHHQQQLNSRQPPSLPPRHQSLGRETAAKGTTSSPSVPPYKQTSHVPGTTLSIISSSSSAPIQQVPPPPPRTVSNRSVSSPTPPGQQASGINLLESSTHIGIGPKNIVTGPKKKLATTRASRSNSHLSSATASSSGSGPSGVEIPGQSNLRSDQPVDRPSGSNPASKFQQFATGSIVSIPPPLPPSRRLSSKSARGPKQDPASTPLSGASLGRSRSLSSAQLPAESRSVSAGSITGHGEGPLLPPPRRAPSLSSTKPRGAFKESSLTNRKQDPFASRLAKVQLKPGTGRSAVRDDDRRALRDDSDFDDDDDDDDDDEDDHDEQDFDSGSQKLFVGDDGQADGVDDDRGLELDDDAMIELEREVRRNSERGWKAL